MVGDHLHSVTDHGHGHTDSGHSHTDSGHSHSASGGSHSHSIYSATYDRYPADAKDDSMIGGCYETQGSGCVWSKSNSHSESNTVSVSSAHATISSAYASIASSKTGIEVDSVVGPETRPKNIAAVYIMRIF
jgi:hypothetical protein